MTTRVIGVRCPAIASFLLVLGLVLGLGGDARALEPRTGPQLGGGQPGIITEPPLPPRPPRPTTRPPLSVLRVGTTWVELRVQRPPGNWGYLYRQVEAGPWVSVGPGNSWELVTVVTDYDSTGEARVRDEHLRPGTTYRYRLYAGHSLLGEVAAETDWHVAFARPTITAGETASILEQFDWTLARDLPAGSPDWPALYYMNVLLDDAYGPDGLRMLGMHVQASPVFPEELAGWRDTTALVVEEGRVTGRWYFAVVPGVLFNDLRAQMVARIERGEEPGIRALVFRRIPVAAGTHAGSPYRLSYSYLGAQGFEFNATPPCQAPEGVSCVRLELVGWLSRKVIHWAAETIEGFVEDVRGAFGRIKRLVKGEVTLDLQFRLLNTDAGFGATTMQSGWSGEELRLANVRVHVRQALAAFYGTTDEDGRVQITVAKNSRTRICVEAENDFVMLTEFLTESLVCFESIGELTADRAEIVEVTRPYLNVLAQMTDAARYLERVAGHRMRKITVLVGDMADDVAVLGRAFAPCMGRFPGLIGAAGDVLLAGLFPGAALGGEITEFLLSVDIVLPPNVERSRGVGVHEYGHAIFCDMLSRESSAQFEDAWTDIIFATADQSADNEATYLNEAFADFITSQVVGGTNYFPPTNFLATEGVSYCLASTGACLDENFDEADLLNVNAFGAQVRRVASLLHDAFDGHAAVEQPNDGAHWDMASGTGNAIHVLGNTSDLGDEPIALEGSDLPALFAYWNNRGVLLREASFLGGLADMMRDRGYDNAEISALFAQHEASGACPDYVCGYGGGGDIPWPPRREK